MYNCVSLRPLALYLFSLTPLVSLAAGPVIEEIEITGQMEPIESHQANILTRLTREGVHFSAAGGISALPALNGLGADRVKVLIDGAESGVACANQMNPPLSYISGTQISELSIMAGISPVSVAGDNIAGVISVNAIEPRYSEETQLQWQSGYLAGEYRSVSSSRQVSLGARAASDRVSVAYSGAFEDAKSYDDGRGDRVLDTLYRAQNHSLVSALRDERQQIAVKLSHQYIPFQGYPNQYMDMTENRSTGVVVQYQRNLSRGGVFEGQASGQQVIHEMGFFTQEKPGTMPMNTEAEEASYKLRWRLPLTERHTLLLGHEYHDHQLDDWWPAVEDSTMMGPNDYRNITQGKRQRIAGYVELRSQLNSAWTLLGGVRVEDVVTDVGEVQAYNSMPMMGIPNADHQAAEDFNNAERERLDTNIDVTVLARYQWDEFQSVELGVARKRRSPNLYERYSWGRGAMAATMIGWFGDGNGYVGRITLEPETAHTLSANYTIGNEQSRGQLSLSPYYTEVKNYIDADVIGTFNRTGEPTDERNLLQFTNLDATLYGVNLDVIYRLAESRVGHFVLTAAFDYRRGERDSNEQSLYQVQPLRAQLALSHEWDRWENRLEFDWVDDKDRVDLRRRENRTDGYTRMNFRSVYQWELASLSLGVDNLLDEYYEQPLGGVSIAAFKASDSDGFTPVAGPGRSINAGLKFRF